MASWEFPGSDPLDVHIDVPSGSIDLSAEPTDMIRVTAEPGHSGGFGWDLLEQLQEQFGDLGRRGPDPASLLRVECADGRLEITAPKGAGLRRRGSGVQLTVQVPAGSRCMISTASADITCLGSLGALTVRTASGDVRAAVSTGPADIQTASGDVWMDQVSGDARLHSASGDIRLDQAAADVLVNTASGDLALGAAAGSVTVRGASGDVRLDCVASGEVSVTTVSGDVTVGVAAGTGVYLDLSAVTGDISSQLDESEDDGGPALTLKCRSVSGDINVLRAAPATSR